MNNFFLITLFLSNLFGQNFVREINTIPFEGESGILNQVFSGGVNNPEFQFVDIDADNDPDLFLLSSDGTFQLYKNTGTPKTPEFIYSSEKINGLEILNWFYFVDIDADNDYDCFTGRFGSKAGLYENTGTPSDPSFALMIDTLFNRKGEIVFIESGSNPAFADVDNDGDYDLVSGNTTGTASFYENTGTPENFSFDTLDNNWQNIRIIGGAKLQAITNENLHGASSIDFTDYDDDGDLDLFWGDYFNPSLYLLINTGTPFEPNLNLEYETYPPGNDSVFTRGFNMPRLTDIDGDDDLDLFTSTLFNDITVKSTISFYRNDGDRSSPDFNFLTDDYINSLDTGSRSIPSFVDIDGDNDLDLFIGAENLFNDGSIYFYENTGSIYDPKYTYITGRFAGIHFEGEISLAPTFGDLDSDGDYDLVVGKFSDEVVIYENTGNESVPEFTPVTELNIGEGFLTYLRPRLFDYDNDNDLDLLISEFNGELLLYENTGTPVEFNFAINENYFNVSVEGNYTNINMFDLDRDDKPELFIGSDNGELRYYKNIGSIASPNFVMQNEKFLNTDFGAEPNPFFADIDNDSDIDIFVGNIKGGLYFFRNQNISAVEDKPDDLEKRFDLKIEAYPNPFNGELNVITRVPKNALYSLAVFNILGEKVALIKSGTSPGGKMRVNWKTNRLVSGQYFITLITGKMTKVFPVVLLN